MKHRILNHFTAVGMFDEFELTLELFGVMFPDIFSHANGLRYGQGSNLPVHERNRIMNELWASRWKHSSSHPIEAEWEHSVVNFAQEWLSHEIDAYNLAKQQFWTKIAHFQVDVYKPKIDSSGQIQFNRDMGKIQIVLNLNNSVESHFLQFHDFHFSNNLSPSDLQFENDEQVRNFYKNFPDAESHFQNGLKSVPEVPTSTITHETKVTHTVSMTGEGANAGINPENSQNDAQVASMQMQMQQQMLEYQQLQNQLMMQAQQQQQMYQFAGAQMYRMVVIQCRLFVANGLIISVKSCDRRFRVISRYAKVISHVLG